MNSEQIQPREEGGPDFNQIDAGSGTILKLKNRFFRTILSGRRRMYVCSAKQILLASRMPRPCSMGRTRCSQYKQVQPLHG